MVIGTRAAVTHDRYLYNNLAYYISDNVIFWLETRNTHEINYNTTKEKKKEKCSKVFQEKTIG